MVFVYIFRTSIFTLLFGQISAEVWAHANTYLMIVMLTVPFIAVYNCGAAIFRTMGNAKIPMYIMAVCDIVNILGNAYCIYYLGWGVEGVAIPTLIARIISTFIMVRFILKIWIKHICKQRANNSHIFIRNSDYYVKFINFFFSEIYI